MSMNPFMELGPDEANFLMRYKELIDTHLTNLITKKDDIYGFGAAIADMNVTLFNLGRKYEEELHSS